MKIVKKEWNIDDNSVHFEVHDGQGEWVCLITQNELDLENSYGYLEIDEKIALALFDKKEEEILMAAKKVIEDAKARGIEHKFGMKNEPLHVLLSAWHQD